MVGDYNSIYLIRRVYHSTTVVVVSWVFAMNDWLLYSTRLCRSLLNCNDRLIGTQERNDKLIQSAERADRWNKITRYKPWEWITLATKNLPVVFDNACKVSTCAWATRHCSSSFQRIFCRLLWFMWGIFNYFQTVLLLIEVDRWSLV